MSQLKDGQFQIGDLKFGRGTGISIVGVDQIGYEVTPGDYPIPQSDEIRFRRDYIKPGVIQFALAAVDNYILPGMSGTLPVGSGSDESLEKFRAEWRADEIRSSWGWVKPLTYRGPGVARVLFGRPRNLASDRRKSRSSWYNITCSYQLSDALSYSEEIFSEEAAPGATASVVRGEGRAATWLTAVITGPVVNPVIDLGPEKVTLDVTIGEGESIVLSANPWERRAVAYRAALSENIGWRMVDGSSFLEDLRIPPGESWDVKMTATGTSANTKLMVLWREAYHAI